MKNRNELSAMTLDEQVEYFHKNARYNAGLKLPYSIRVGSLRGIFARSPDELLARFLRELQPENADAT